MDTQRTILFFGLSFVLLLLWQAWQEDYVRPQATPTTSVVNAAAPEIEQGGELPIVPQGGTAPAADTPQMSSTPATPQSVAPMSQVLNSDKRIHVVTDLYDLEIDTVGGDLRRVDLLTYPVAADKPDEPFRLMEDKGFRLFIAQSGLLSGGPAPDHHAVYEAEQLEYSLGSGNELKVPLYWTSEDGITVTKTYTFKRDSFVIEVDHQIVNNGSVPWRGHQYRQLQRTAAADSEKSAFIYTYTGGVIYSEEEKYEKIYFDDMDDENLSRDINGGWAGIIQHYFIGAWIPDQNETNHFYSKALEDGRYTLGMVSPEVVVEPGATSTFSSRLYVGSKEQDRLEPVAEGLILAVDYGVLTLLADPLFWLLKLLYEWVGNWGWAIIILTLLIKLVFFKLSEKSYRSMANMRKVTPKITAIRERYIDDRQRMSQAMMELYKKEKINPMGGCLPMLVQIPVFIALYWVLLESVELRQASFVLWLDDLSTKDPYYVLPLLMGLTMYIQQQLNPKPPDPMQAKIMAALPFIFTLFFAFFPSGLVLYWVANAILSILQQWYITRRIDMGLDDEDEKKNKNKAKPKKGKGSKNKPAKAIEASE